MCHTASPNLSDRSAALPSKKRQKKLVAVFNYWSRWLWICFILRLFYPDDFESTWSVGKKPTRQLHRTMTHDSLSYFQVLRFHGSILSRRGITHFCCPHRLKERSFVWWKPAMDVNQGLALCSGRCVTKYTCTPDIMGGGVSFSFNNSETISQT